MIESEDQQLFFIHWAIRLGEKGRYTTAPNPWVGCVIVRDGQIVGEGYHVVAGGKHAEIIALEQAGRLSQGATAYVSLEPCAHYGRTPPCTEALIKAGIKKVVVPLLDPDPHVAGQGVALLKAAGIEVAVGLGQAEASASLKPYLYHRMTGLPFCHLKSAISLDGRTAATDGTSQWLTGEEARRDAHHLRAASQAILIGSETALIDHPRLTVRGIEVVKQPLRVILDRRGRLAAEGPLADISLAHTLIFTSNPHYRTAWEEKGADVICHNDLSLPLVLQELGRRGILQVLVEGGSHLHTSFVKEHLANRFTIYLSSSLLGTSASPFLPHLLIPTLSDAPHWTLESVHRFGNDLRIDYLPQVAGSLF